MSVDIVCTIGPTSQDQDTLRELIAHGMTVARMNMSHGDHRVLREVIQTIRRLASEQGKKVRIMGDLQGPKIRLGKLKEPEVTLTEGNIFRIYSNPIIGDENQVSVDYPGITQDAKQASRILINDGEIQLRVKKVHPDHLETEVLVGGKISSHKGVNLPGVSISMPALTEKDKQDIRFLLLEKVDMIACSFIRTAAHLDEIRTFGGITQGHPPQVIAKIETMEGIRNFSSILAKSDGIMIARGDLGVELPFPWIPLIQKAIILECRRANSYVITATQMLQSMIDHPIPTRAEVSDIFQAVIDGTHAVMLSAETAAGEYPVQSAEVMKTIARFAERVHTNQPFDLGDMMDLLAEDYPMVVTSY
ncbi:pyruvate kinase [Brevibacillus sp. SYSU BS000544]|uniref:pyruvate kinase n=1 Tax=Brevibacillus sp. SYSU BS000544 TaxID=3416443 RepID=UPI003CE598A6